MGRFDALKKLVNASKGLLKNELTHSPVSSEIFRNTLKNASKESDKVKEFVHLYDPSEYSGMKTFLSADGKSGYAIKPDGDLVSVFSTQKGRGDTIVQEDIKNGAVKLDAFDGYLPTLYKKHGFEELKREKNWTPGGPDVVYMGLQDSLKKQDKLFSPGLLPVSMGVGLSQINSQSKGGENMGKLNRFEKLMLNIVPGVRPKDIDYLDTETGESIEEKNRVIEARDRDLTSNPETATPEEAQMREEELAKMMDLASVGIGSISNTAKALAQTAPKALGRTIISEAKPTQIGTVRKLEDLVPQRPQAPPNPPVRNNLVSDKITGNRNIDMANANIELEKKRELWKKGFINNQQFSEAKQSLMDLIRRFNGEKL
jgi:hypothetical protein